MEPRDMERHNKLKSKFDELGKEILYWTKYAQQFLTNRSVKYGQHVYQIQNPHQVRYHEGELQVMLRCAWVDLDLVELVD